MTAAINPIVHGIFDPATWTVTYVVYEKEGSACAKKWLGLSEQLNPDR